MLPIFLLNGEATRLQAGDILTFDAICEISIDRGKDHLTFTNGEKNLKIGTDRDDWVGLSNKFRKILRIFAGIELEKLYDRSSSIVYTVKISHGHTGKYLTEINEDQLFILAKIAYSDGVPIGEVKLILIEDGVEILMNFVPGLGPTKLRIMNNGTVVSFWPDENQKSGYRFDTVNALKITDYLRGQGYEFHDK